MRKCNRNKLNIEELFFRKHHILVYVTPKIPDHYKVLEYEKAVKVLPKKMIYSICDIED